MYINTPEICRQGRQLEMNACHPTSYFRWAVPEGKNSETLDQG